MKRERRIDEKEDEEEDENDSGSLNDLDPHSTFDDALRNRVASQAGDVVNVEFAHEMLAMLVHRFETDTQFRRDLLVGPAFGNQLQHFDFTRTQVIAAFL